MIRMIEERGQKTTGVLLVVLVPFVLYVHFFLPGLDSLT